MVSKTALNCPGCPAQLDVVFASLWQRERWISNNCESMILIAKIFDFQEHLLEAQAYDQAQKDLR